jgi:L-iditol 2-dehydrogenase
VKAARLMAAGTVELVERALPAPQDHEVVIAITECGVCGSDVDLWLGNAPDKLPMFIGHEIAGVVDDVGAAVTDLRPGDRVVAWIPDGGFAERVIADRRWCIPIRSDVAYPAIAEPLGCALNTVELARPRAGADVVIVGGGFMATLIQLLSLARGPRSVSVISGSLDTRERALALGAQQVLAPERSTSDLHLALGDGADVVYEVTGDPDRLVLAGNLVRMSGTLCIAGYHQSKGGDRTIPLGRWNAQGITIANAHFRQLDTILSGMEAAVRLIEAGTLGLDRFAPQRFVLSDITAALEAATARAPGFVKAVVEP